MLGNRRLVAALAIAVWLAAVASGFMALESYENTPGEVGTSEGRWPAGSALSPAAGIANVVMAVHPRCVCTRASVVLLERIAAQTGRSGAFRLLVYRPEGSEADWGRREFPMTLRTPDGVSRVDDPGGVLASRFGLATSGAVAAFDASGRLRFTGGLTASRGRDVPSLGAGAILEILQGREPGRSSETVFGCGLASAANRRRDGGGPP